MFHFCFTESQSGVSKSVACPLGRGGSDRLQHGVVVVSKSDLALHGVWESPESQVLVVDLSKNLSGLYTSLYTGMVKVTTLIAHSTEHETK